VIQTDFNRLPAHAPSAATLRAIRHAHFLHRIALREIEPAIVVFDANEVVGFQGHVQFTRTHGERLPRWRAPCLDEGRDEWRQSALVFALAWHRQ
jgi:hypothetical protein